MVDQLTSRGIGFRSLTEGLHTDGPMGKAMLTIMAAFAQLERDTMIERTRAGLVAAAAKGRKGGRPRKVDDADTAKARQLRDKGIAAVDIAKMLGVSRATVYRYLAVSEPVQGRLNAWKGCEAPVKTVTKSKCEVLIAAELGIQSNKRSEAAKFSKPVYEASEFLGWLVRTQ